MLGCSGGAGPFYRLRWQARIEILGRETLFSRGAGRAGGAGKREGKREGVKERKEMHVLIWVEERKREAGRREGSSRKEGRTSRTEEGRKGNQKIKSGIKLGTAKHGGGSFGMALPEGRHR
jgi:hypothetical protein